MIIIIMDYVGDGGNDIQRLDSTVEPRFSGVDQKDLQLGQEKILRVCIKTWVSTMCHSTISAVRQMHVAEGYGDPRMSSMARLEQVLKGIKSLQESPPICCSK